MHSVRRCLAQLLLLLMVSPIGAASFAPAAQAESGPVGIGFAQAEEGTWYCRGGDPVRALDCARAKCRAEGGGQSCARTAWCYPARWSGLMVVWLSDFHVTVPLCGAPSWPALRSALVALCAGTEGMTSCGLELIIDPDGKERPGEGVPWPSPEAVQNEASEQQRIESEGVPAEQGQ